MIIKLTIATRDNAYTEKAYQRLAKQDGAVTIFNGHKGMAAERRRVFIFRLWRVELYLELPC